MGQVGTPAPPPATAVVPLPAGVAADQLRYWDARTIDFRSKGAAGMAQMLGGQAFGHAVVDGTIRILDGDSPDLRVVSWWLPAIREAAVRGWRGRRARAGLPPW